MKKYSKPTIKSKKLSAKMGSRNRPIYGAIEDLLISDVYANTVFIPMIMSDKRAKQGIRTMTGVLKNIHKLRAVTYTWDPKINYRSGSDIGVIAQEVASVYPDLVQKFPNSKYFGVNYAGLTAVLLQAVKELEKQNSHLTSQLLKLQKAIGKRHNGR